MMEQDSSHHDDFESVKLASISNNGKILILGLKDDNWVLNTILKKKFDESTKNLNESHKTNEFLKAKLMNLIQDNIAFKERIRESQLLSDQERFDRTLMGKNIDSMIDVITILRAKMKLVDEEKAHLEEELIKLTQS